MAEPDNSAVKSPPQFMDTEADPFAEVFKHPLAQFILGNVSWESAVKEVQHRLPELDLETQQIWFNALRGLSKMPQVIREQIQMNFSKAFLMNPRAGALVVGTAHLVYAIGIEDSFSQHLRIKEEPSTGSLTVTEGQVDEAKSLVEEAEKIKAIYDKTAKAVTTINEVADTLRLMIDGEMASRRVQPASPGPASSPRGRPDDIIRYFVERIREDGIYEREGSVVHVTGGIVTSVSSVELGSLTSLVIGQSAVFAGLVLNIPFKHWKDPRFWLFMQLVERTNVTTERMAYLTKLYDTFPPLLYSWSRLH